LGRIWAERINRLLRRGPPRHYSGPEVPEIAARLGGLAVGGPGDWRALPRLAETYFLPTAPRLTPAMIAQAEAVRSGEFRVSGRFPPEKLGLPPRWDANPRGDYNWLSTLQGMEWVASLVHAHYGQPERGWLETVASVIADWIEHNPFRGAPSRWSWHDHATAKRLRLFAWFWEHYRQSEAFDPEFARLLLASVYQHVQYGLDERNYRHDSNHGLEATGALLAAALTFPMFREAGEWERTALARLDRWLTDNLSPEGFHLEQSPAYHWFVLLRLAAIERFLRANGRAAPALSEASERVARAWPWLLKPDGTMPAVGDSAPGAPADWRKVLKSRWGREAPAEEPHAEMVVSERAGYAIFRAAGDADTYALFRCAARISPHCHYDGLSFVLFGLGREQLRDSGFLSYHEWDPRRQYLRSPRAHSVALAGPGSFRTQECRLLEWGRADGESYALSYQDQPEGRHTRRFAFRPPREVVVEDRFDHSRRRPRPWRQLWQVGLGLGVEIVSEREAHLVSEDGSRCVIEQSVSGRWEVVTGRERPTLQGWYSAGYGEWEPATTLIFHVPLGEAAVKSSLTLCPARVAR